MQSDRKKISAGCIIAAVFIICAVAGVTVYINSPAHKLARQLSLGQKYLEALDYEQAVLAYNTALRIDEKEPKAYIGLAKVYAAGNKLTEAESILKKGLAVTDDSKIRQMLENVQNELSVRNDASGGDSNNGRQSGTQQSQSDQQNKADRSDDSNQSNQQSSQPENRMSEDYVSAVDISSAGKGEYIRLGTYEQDNNTANGKEAIYWLVLEEKDDTILVISMKCLDAKAFKNTGTSNRYNMEEAEWYNSDLRQWLNSDFADEAFTANEQGIILASKLDNSGVGFNKYGYMSTEDKIFCLNADEAGKYFDNDASRRARVTAYAKDKGASAYQGCTSWWLRNMSGEQKAACVLDTGKISESGTGVNISTEGVRPAMWIKRQNVAYSTSEVASGTADTSSQASDRQNLTRAEMNEIILAHYNAALGSSGEYTILDYESVEDNNKYVVTLRYNQNRSDEEIAKFRAEGIWPSANVISGTVTVNKKTGEVTYTGLNGQKSDEIWKMW